MILSKEEISSLRALYSAEGVVHPIRQDLARLAKDITDLIAVVHKAPNMCLARGYRPMNPFPGGIEYQHVASHDEAVESLYNAALALIHAKERTLDFVMARCAMPPLHVHFSSSRDNDVLEAEYAIILADFRNYLPY